MIRILAIGGITPLGRTWPESWGALLNGESRSTPYWFIRRDVGIMTDVAPVARLRRSVDDAGRGAACLLAKMAVADALSRSHLGRFDGDMNVGSNHGESDVIDILVRRQDSRSRARAKPLPWRALVEDPLAAEPEGSLRKPLYVSSACTTGMHALHIAAQQLQQAGDERVKIVVATDALSSIGVAGFTRAGATGRGACEPFQEQSHGMLVGEGAIALVISASDNDKDGTARAWILSSGISCDAGHPTQPEPEGLYLEQAIRRALQRGRIEPGEVGAIVAHGTGTRANDQAETRCIQRIFGSHGVPVTSPKGALGHLMSAAGLVNVAVACEIVQSGKVPPTIGEGKGVHDLDLVQGRPRKVRSGAPVLALASGFGGNNAAILVGTRAA